MEQFGLLTAEAMRHKVEYNSFQMEIVLCRRSGQVSNHQHHQSFARRGAVTHQLCPSHPMETDYYYAHFRDEELRLGEAMCFANHRKMHSIIQHVFNRYLLTACQTQHHRSSAEQK